MYFIDKEYSNLYEIKKSKFYAHIVPYSQFDETLELLKTNHPKARHFVYAYRYLNEFNQIVENSSDDGEPKGTSGKPTLGVISGASVINSAVIIVRYFGGIKLGTGGLVRAYGNSVKEVLDKAELHNFVKLQQIRICFDYSQVSQVEYLISSYDIKIIAKNFEQNVYFILESSQEIFDILVQELFRNIKVEKIDNE